MARSMKNPIETQFLAHPGAVGETYFQHMRFALWISSQLLLAAGAAIIHSLVPRFCEKTASKRIRDLYDLVNPR